MHLCVKYLAIVTLLPQFFYIPIILDFFLKLATNVFYSTICLYCERHIGKPQSGMVTGKSINLYNFITWFYVHCITNNGHDFRAGEFMFRIVIEVS